MKFDPKKWSNDPGPDIPVPDAIGFADAEALGLKPEDFVNGKEFAKRYAAYLRTKRARDSQD